MALPTSPTQADLGPLAGANGELLPIKFQEHVQVHLSFPFSLLQMNIVVAIIGD